MQEHGDEGRKARTNFKKIKTMKKIFFVLLFISVYCLNAQVIGGSMLNLGTRTTAQMNAITSAQGRQVGSYVDNSDTGTLWRYNGSAWVNTGLPSIDASGFSGNLNTEIDDLQKLANAVDTLTVSGSGGETYTFGTGLTNTSGTITVTNPFEQTDEDKLDGIPAGATVGADWDTNLSNIPSDIADGDDDTIADGSETKLSAGTNVTITGTGTTGSPYVINSAGGGTDDQTASEVTITDSGNYFTGTDVESALQELGNGTAGGSFGIVAEGIGTMPSGTGLRTLTITHNLGYVPDTTRIQTQEINSTLSTANITIANITSTTFDIVSNEVENTLISWRIYGSGSIVGQSANEVTITDSGGNFTATDVEGALAELAASGGTPTTDASDLTTGTLADARLSTNVLLKNGNNTYPGVNNFNNLVTIHGTGQLNLSPVTGADWILDNTALYKGTNPPDFVDNEDLFLQRIVNSGDTPQFVFDAAGDATIDEHVLNKGTADSFYAPIGASGSDDQTGAEVLLTGYTKGTDGTAVEANDTTNEAIAKLENQIENAVISGGANNDVFTGQELTDGYTFLATDFDTGRKVFWYDGATDIEVNLATDVASIGEKLILWQYGSGKIQVNKDAALNGISFATTDSINPVTLTKQFSTFGYRPVGNWENYSPVTSAIQAFGFKYDWNAESGTVGTFTTLTNDGTGSVTTATVKTGNPTIVDEGGNKAFLFDGDDAISLGVPSDFDVNIASDNATIILVFGDVIPAGITLFSDRNTDRNFNIGSNAESNILLQVGSSQYFDTGLTKSGGWIYEVNISGGLIDTYANGVLIEADRTVGTDATLREIVIGSRQDATNFWNNGTLRRVLYTTDIMDSTERANIVTELQTVNN